MPRLDYMTCRNCGRSRDEAGLLSRSRLCAECSAALLNENIDGIHFRSGRAFARWRIGTVASALGNPALVKALADAGAFSYLDERGDTA